ncbi:MAG: hypothetical protein KGD58_18165 [Candidatus Lokiarchaeota archaeon]|nr:hypothetical protein [Candidatus Lokiarchaeota archaeon]
MCAEEFASFLDSTRKAPMEEKLSAFGDIVEKIMQIVLKIPDLVDNSIQDVNSKLTNLQNQLTAMNQDITTLRSRPAGSPGIAAPALSSSPGAPPGGPPRSPPPPPGAPPGGARPAPGPAPGPARPASPVSLRGAIMGELKQLFQKRKQQTS